MNNYWLVQMSVKLCSIWSRVEQIGIKHGNMEESRPKQSTMWNLTNCIFFAFHWKWYLTVRPSVYLFISTYVRPTNHPSKCFCLFANVSRHVFISFFLFVGLRLMWFTEHGIDVNMLQMKITHNIISSVR